MGDENENLDAEAEATAEAAESSTADVKDQDASSSEAKDAKPTLASVIKDAAAKSVAESSTDDAEEKESGEGSAKTESTTEAEDSDKSEKEDKTVVVDEKDKELPFHKHPRFQEVIKERSTFKQKSEELTPFAERAKSIDSYCQKHGISGEEFNSVMELTALTHVNPAEALKALRTYVETLEVSLGNKLPSDLQKEVDDGTLSVERAKELTNARIKNQGLEHTSKRSEAQIAQERQAAITTAVNSWDSQKRSSDAAYDKKYPLIEKSFIALCTMTPPRNPQEAIVLAEKAYADVNTALGSFTPKPPQRKVLKPNGSVSKGSIEIKPGMSLREALPLIARKVVAEQSR